jgi:hypothetical protein
MIEAQTVSDQDRRRAKRVDVNTAFSEADPRTTTPVSNLSGTGAFVYTDQLYPLGARIELRFVVFPDAPELFRHTGRVARHSHSPPGMGIEFDPMPSETLALVTRIVERAEDDAKRRSSHRRTRSKRFVFEAQDLHTKLIDD